MTLDVVEAPGGDPEWIALLRAEVGRGRSIADVARQVGMTRPSLSMLLAGTYPAGLDRVTATYEPVVLRLLRDQVACPVLGSIERQTCHGHAAAPFVASHPGRVRMWTACRACPLNPLRVAEAPDA